MKHLLKTSLFILFSAQLVASGSNGNSGDSSKVQNNKYSVLSSSLGISMFRDFATSPLFYSGPGIHLGSGDLKITNKKESLFEMSMAGALALSQAPQDDIITTEHSGYFLNFNLYYHHLREIEALKWGIFKLKPGGTILISQNARILPSYSNSAFGVESFINVMMSAKLEADLSRKEEKEFKFLFVKKQLEPVKRSLSLQANIGLLNFNRRPSYNYVYHNGIDGTNTLSVEWLLDSYEWAMNGFRMSTMIEFTQFRKSGNGRKWAYIWDMLSAPGNHEMFQMASHRLQYSILINSK